MPYNRKQKTFQILPMTILQGKFDFPVISTPCPVATPCKLVLNVLMADLPLPRTFPLSYKTTTASEAVDLSDAASS
jgi:hypothetical protein